MPEKNQDVLALLCGYEPEERPRDAKKDEARAYVESTNDRIKVLRENIVAAIKPKTVDDFQLTILLKLFDANARRWKELMGIPLSFPLSSTQVSGLFAVLFMSNGYTGSSFRVKDVPSEFELKKSLIDGLDALKTTLKTMGVVDSDHPDGKISAMQKVMFYSLFPYSGKMDWAEISKTFIALDDYVREAMIIFKDMPDDFEPKKHSPVLDLRQRIIFPFSKMIRSAENIELQITLENITLNVIRNVIFAQEGKPVSYQALYEMVKRKLQEYYSKKNNIKLPEGFIKALGGMDDTTFNQAADTTVSYMTTAPKESRAIEPEVKKIYVDYDYTLAMHHKEPHINVYGKRSFSIPPRGEEEALQGQTKPLFASKINTELLEHLCQQREQGIEVSMVTNGWIPAIVFSEYVRLLNAADTLEKPKTHDFFTELYQLAQEYYTVPAQQKEFVVQFLIDQGLLKDGVSGGKLKAALKTPRKFKSSDYIDSDRLATYLHSVDQLVGFLENGEHYMRVHKHKGDLDQNRFEPESATPVSFDRATVNVTYRGPDRSGFTYLQTPTLAQSHREWAEAHPCDRFLMFGDSSPDAHFTEKMQAIAPNNAGRAITIEVPGNHRWVIHPSNNAQPHHPIPFDVYQLSQLMAEPERSAFLDTYYDNLPESQTMAGYMASYQYPIQSWSQNCINPLLNSFKYAFLSQYANYTENGHHILNAVHKNVPRSNRLNSYNLALDIDFKKLSDLVESGPEAAHQLLEVFIKAVQYELSIHEKLEHKNTALIDKISAISMNLAKLEKLQERTIPVPPAVYETLGDICNLPFNDPVMEQYKNVFESILGKQVTAMLLKEGNAQWTLKDLVGNPLYTTCTPENILRLHEALKTLTKISYEQRFNPQPAKKRTGLASCFSVPKPEDRPLAKELASKMEALGISNVVLPTDDKLQAWQAGNFSWLHSLFVSTEVEETREDLAQAPATKLMVVKAWLNALLDKFYKNDYQDFQLQYLEDILEDTFNQVMIELSPLWQKEGFKEALFEKLMSEDVTAALMDIWQEEKDGNIVNKAASFIKDQAFHLVLEMAHSPAQGFKEEGQEDLESLIAAMKKLGIEVIDANSSVQRTLFLAHGNSLKCPDNCVS